MVAVTDTGFELLTPWPEGGKLSRNLLIKSSIIYRTFYVALIYGCSERCSTK